jgi:hypothetical protein
MTKPPTLTVGLNVGLYVNDNWILGYVIEFSDGGEPEIQILHKGSEESCEKMANLLPAVSYSGDRPNPSASLIWMPAGSDV